MRITGGVKITGFIHRDGKLCGVRFKCVDCDSKLSIPATRSEVKCGVAFGLPGWKQSEEIASEARDRADRRTGVACHEALYDSEAGAWRVYTPDAAEAFEAWHWFCYATERKGEG